MKDRRDFIAAAAVGAAALGVAPAALAKDPKNAPEIANAHFTHETLFMPSSVEDDAAILPRPVSLSLPKNLTRRRLYVLIRGGNLIDQQSDVLPYYRGTVDFSLHGNVVYSVPFTRHESITATSAHTHVNAVSVRLGAEAQNVAAGSVVYSGFQPCVENSLVITTGTLEFIVPPWAINIAADTVTLRFSSFWRWNGDTVGGAFGILACHSEGMVQE